MAIAEAKPGARQMRVIPQKTPNRPDFKPAAVIARYSTNLSPTEKMHDFFRNPISPIEQAHNTFESFALFYGATVTEVVRHVNS
jgi:hypothetical protein